MAYALWSTYIGGNITLSDGNRVATRSANAYWASVIGDTYQSTGKRYC
jgi:hypothetical protein